MTVSHNARSSQSNPLYDKVLDHTTRKRGSRNESMEDMHDVVRKMQRNNEDQKTLLLHSACRNAEADIINAHTNNNSGGNSFKQITESIAAITKADQDVAKARLSILSATQAQEAASTAAFNSAQGYYGKVIKYNDNSRHYSGQPVAFAYKLSHNAEINGSLCAKIAIIDKSGRKIYNKEVSDLKLGDNLFIWKGELDGEYNNADPGDYEIDVEAYCKSGDSKVDVTASTISEDTVNSVVRDGNDIILKMESGKDIGSRHVVEICGNSNNDNAPSDMNAHLLNKQVQISLDKVRVKNGSAEIAFASDIDASEVIVDVYDSKNKHVAVAKAQSASGFKSGYNTFQWDCRAVPSVEGLDEANALTIFPKLPDGEYMVKTRVITSDSVEHNTRDYIETSAICEISAQNVIDSTMSSYPCWRISALKDNHSSANGIYDITSGMSYMGKIARYYGHFRRTEDNQLNSIAVNVIKHNKIRVTVIDAKGDKVKVIENDTTDWAMNAAPRYSRLHEDSKHVVDKFIAQNPCPVGSNQLEQEQYKKDVIDNLFRRGMIFQDSYDGKTYSTMSDQEKQELRMRNMGLYTVSWDGCNDAGLKMPAGCYDYYISYDDGEDTKDIRSHRIIEIQSGNGRDISFKTSAGDEILAEQILSLAQ